MEKVFCLLFIVAVMSNCIVDKVSIIEFVYTVIMDRLAMISGIDSVALANEDNYKCYFDRSEYCKYVPIKQMIIYNARLQNRYCIK